MRETYIFDNKFSLTKIHIKIFAFIFGKIANSRKRKLKIWIKLAMKILIKLYYGNILKT